MPPSQFQFPSTGFLYDGDESTPLVAATLNFDPVDGVRLSVPYSLDHDQGHKDWFHSSGDNLPKRLAFHDNQAAMHLVNCRTTGYLVGLGGMGTGYISADYAIEDRDGNTGPYDDIHRMRSQVVGLHELAGWKMSDTRFEHNADGTIKSATISTITPDSVTVGLIDDQFETSIEPIWRGGEESSSIAAVRAATWIQTVTSAPAAIHDHLTVHRALRDLVALSFWQPLDFFKHEVMHEQQPARVLSGKTIGPAWRPLHTIRGLRSRHDVDSTSAFPALRINSLGGEGLRNWLVVRKSWARILDPLLGLLFAENATLDVALMQTSIAAEAYGYLAAIDQGVSARQAKNIPYAERLSAAVNDSRLDLSDLVAEDVGAWVRRATAAYSATKHANRELPDGMESWLIASVLIIVLRILAFRALGISEDEIGRAREVSPWWQLRQEYHKLRH